ncbi:MAG TPA: alpha/beta hydrolase [Rhizomicrobium sp.]|jgi:acetyl esterase|nr:alpha/beta hydrolase [Rhizomicrobium sp.]
MPLHPQAALAIQRAGDLPTDLSPAELRIAYERQRLTLLAQKPTVATTYQLSIPSDFGPIPARFYRATKDKKPCPLLVYFHGGGFMLGTLALYDTTCRRLAAQANCAVLSVHYRLAPETQFPGAVLDAYAATHWASDHAGLLNIDASKIAVGGDSAGGNLAAVVAQMAQDSQEFKLALQVLIYPMTDQSRDYPSYQRNAKGYMLTTAALHWFMDNYIPNVEDRTSPMASPMLRESLSGLPPALIISAEFDPLVDENEAYAERLKAAGVETDYECFAGMIHPFFTLGGVVEDSAKAEALVASALKKLS